MWDIAAITNYEEPNNGIFVTPYKITAIVKNDKLIIETERNRESKIIQIKDGVGHYLDLSWCCKKRYQSLYGALWCDSNEEEEFLWIYFVSSPGEIIRKNIIYLKSVIDQQISIGHIPIDLKKINIDSFLKYNYENDRYDVIK